MIKQDILCLLQKIGNTRTRKNIKISRFFSPSEMLKVKSRKIALIPIYPNIFHKVLFDLGKFSMKNYQINQKK